MLRAINNLEEGFGYVILQVYYVKEDLTGLNYYVNIRAPLAYSAWVEAALSSLLCISLGFRG